MKSSQDRRPQPPGGPQGSLLEGLFPLSCSFCSAGMLTTDLCSVLALGVLSCTLHLEGREGRRILGPVLTLQPAMGTEQGFYMSLLGGHRSEPAQGQDVGLWPEQAAPWHVRIRPCGLCLSWGWTHRQCQGLGDRRVSANVLSIWFQLLVAELLVHCQVSHILATPGAFYSPSLPSRCLGSAWAGRSCSTGCPQAVLPRPQQPGPAHAARSRDTREELPAPGTACPCSCSTLGASLDPATAGASPSLGTARGPWENRSTALRGQGTRSTAGV